MLSYLLTHYSNRNAILCITLNTRMPTPFIYSVRFTRSVVSIVIKLLTNQREEK